MSRPIRSASHTASWTAASWCTGTAPSATHRGLSRKLILYGCGDLVDDYEGIRGYIGMIFVCSTCRV